MEISNTQLFILLAILIPIVLIEGVWVFRDARRRKEKYYWLWGIFALMNVGNLFIYLLVTRVILNNKKKK